MVETDTSADNSEWLPKKQTSLKRAVPLLLLGLLVFVGYLYFFVDIPEMLKIIQQIDVFYYGLAIVVLVLNLFAYSLVWQYLLRPMSIKVGFIKTLLITWVGAFIEFFVPSEAVGEDVSKSYLMAKESGENTGKVVASVLGQRIISMLVTVIILVFCSISLFVMGLDIPSSVSVLMVLISVGTAIPLLFILLLCKKEKLSHKIIDLLIRFCVWVARGRLNREDLQAKAKTSLESFHQSIGILGKNPKILILPLLFSLASYFLSVLVSYFVFVSLGYFTINFILLTIVYSLSRSLQSIPTMLPGEVGFIEIVMTSLYIALLGPEAAAISAASTVLTRVLWVWFRLPLGFVALQWAIRRGLL
ncbi:MAG: lysylphosphatidylglycerol synthase transmembrane domain-containing protein [archaeon]|nr:flippase-like domain-containing protein [Candidatus Bathyarchaeum sp.]